MPTVPRNPVPTPLAESSPLISDKIRTESGAAWFQFFLAIALFSLPQVTGWVTNGGHYTPFSIGASVSDLVYDETFEYASQVSAWIRRGTFAMESVVELVPGKGIYPPLPIVLTAAVAKAVGSLEWAWMLFHLVLPALLWLYLYRLFRRFHDDWLVCSALAWGVLLVPFGPRNALLLGRFSFRKPIDYARFPDPCLTFLFLVGSLSLLAAAERSTRAAILAGIAGGALFYSYYFFWIAFLGAVGLQALAALGCRQPKAALRRIGIGALAVAIGLPYLLLTHRAQSAMQPLMARMGDFGRRPDLVGIAILLAAGIRLIHQRRRGPLDDSTAQIHALLAVIGAVGIGLNFQVLTGYNAQHQKHFYNMVFQPIVAMLAAIFLLTVLRRWQSRLAPRTIVAFTALLLVATFYREFRCGRDTAQDHRSDSRVYSALTWARGAIDPNAVIASTEPDVFPLIPAITGNPSFVPVSARSSATAQDMMKRYLLAGYFEGKNFTQLQVQLFALPVGYRDRPWLSTGYLLWGAIAFSPDADLRSLLEKEWATLDPAKDLANRRLDYLLLPRTTPLDRVHAHFRQVSFAYENAQWLALQVADPF